MEVRSVDSCAAECQRVYKTKEACEKPQSKVFTWLQAHTAWQPPSFAQLGASAHGRGDGHRGRVSATMALAACSVRGAGPPLGSPGALVGFPGQMPLPGGLPALPGGLTGGLVLPALQGGPSTSVPGLPRSVSAMHLGRSWAGSMGGSAGGSPSGGVGGGGVDAAGGWRLADHDGGSGLAAVGVYGGMGARSASASNLPALGLAGQVAWMPGAHLEWG